MDAAIGRELLRAIEPLAIEAALHAEHRYMEQESEQRRIVELELQQHVRTPHSPGADTPLATRTIDSLRLNSRRVWKPPYSAYKGVRRD